MDDLLSDHNGILSKIVPPSAIKLANDEVSNAVDDKGIRACKYYGNSNSSSLFVRSIKNCYWCLIFVKVHFIKQVCVDEQSISNDSHDAS